MKKVLLVIPLIVLLLFVGCNGTIVINDAEVVEPVENSEYLPPDQPTTAGTIIEYTNLEKLKTPLKEGFGIGEECELDGVYPGYSERVPLLVRNGEDRERTFVIYVVNSPKTKEGFEPIPDEYLCWFTVEEPEFTLGAGEYHWVNILIAIPKDIDYTDKHVEVRIRVNDITQSGLVRIAYDSIWYIITAG